jgi:hypothetical protein
MISCPKLRPVDRKRKARTSSTILLFVLLSPLGFSEEIFSSYHPNVLKIFLARGLSM